MLLKCVGFFVFGVSRYRRWKERLQRSGHPLLATRSVLHLIHHGKKKSKVYQACTPSLRAV